MATPTKSIKGTQTEKNLVISYLNETQAYARYTYYAQQADKEQYFPIGQIFRETADNELHHAKVFFKMLQGGTVSVPMDADAGVIGDTATNLQISINEENAEGVDAYKKFAAVAEEEGFPKSPLTSMLSQRWNLPTATVSNAISSRCRMAQCGNVTTQSFGAALCVATNLPAQSPRRNVRAATIPTSTTWLWTDSRLYLT